MQLGWQYEGNILELGVILSNFEPKLRVTPLLYFFNNKNPVLVCTYVGDV